MTTITRAVDPIPRIEGHLGVKLTLGEPDTTTGSPTFGRRTVTGADAHGNMFRGFENFLVGRDPNDAITFTQRICGVCPVPHGMTSTYAIDAVYGYSNGHITFATDNSGDGLGVPPKAVHVRNLILGAEFLMSSITHFYHLAAPSYVQGPHMPPWTPYFDTGYYAPQLLSGDRDLPTVTGGVPADLWSAVILQYVKALRMRRLTFEAGALFAGRMPMTSAYVAGGVTTQSKGADFRERCKKFYNLMHEVGLFIVKEYVPLALALGALYPTYDNAGNTGVGGVRGTGIGAGLGNFLSWGAFPNPVGNTLALRGGFKLHDQTSPTVLVNGKIDVQDMIAAVNANLIEDTHRSWYTANARWGYPTSQSWQKPGDVTRTEPNRDKSGDKYSWMKAPRWRVVTGSPGSEVVRYHAMEVGPLARMVVQEWYPVDGVTTLRSRFNVTGYFGYAGYFVNADTDANLDTNVIDGGLVSALSAGSLLGPVQDWIRGLRGGLSVMDRIRARALESLVLVQLMLGSFDKTATGGGRFGSVDTAGIPINGWIGAAAHLERPAPPGELDADRLAREAAARSYISRAVPLNPRSSYGATEAPRGSLSHHVSIDRGRIASYQCVVPTTWNGSPKDGLADTLRGVVRVATTPIPAGSGAMEAAMIGSPYDGERTGYTTSPGVEAMRIAQSFDPCIACAVH